MTKQQPSFDALLIHPVIVPTTEVGHGAEYIENEPVYWNNQSWEVLDWDGEHNAFVLLSDEDWQVYIDIHASTQERRELRAEILRRVWEEE
jgi:hypothetical protein